MSNPKDPIADLDSATQPAFALERDPDFDEVVDSEGPILIRNKEFVRSDVLASDPIAYREARDEYHEEQLGALLDTAIDRFPHPIAHCLYRYLNSAQTENERLQFLKDTWESFISVIYALTLSEVRARGEGISVTSDRIRDFRRYLDSQNIRDRLEVIRVTCEVGGHLPILRSLIEVGTVAQMIDLNQRRNEDFAHLSTLNDRQSAELAADIEKEVIAILRKATQLENIQLARHLGPTRRRGESKFELFVGHGSTRRIEHRPVSAVQAAAVSQRSQEDVLALCGETVLALSPTIVWRDGRGHRSELAFMKKRRVDGLRSVFTFEVFGDAVEFESDAVELLQDLNATKDLYHLAEEQTR